MSEQILADGTVETPSVEDLQARLAKAEAKIVELKKAPTKEVETEVVTPEKTETTTTNGLSHEQLEAFYNEKKFFESKPDMLEYKEKFDEFTSKGLTYEQAEKLVIDANPDIVARQKTQNSNFTAGTPTFNKTEYTIGDLENMNQKEYEQVMKLKEEGKVVIK